MMSRFRLPAACLACALFFLLAAPLVFPGDAGTRWRGVDEAVVEKFASEHGREARPPLVRTDSGDLPLLVFLLAGATGGFAAGYYWRKLMEGKGR